MSGYNSESHSFKAPSLALHLGTTMKHICDIARKVIVKQSPLFSCSEPEVILKEIKFLRELIQNHWNSKVSSLALKNLNEKKNKNLSNICH